MPRLMQLTTVLATLHVAFSNRLLQLRHSGLSSSMSTSKPTGAWRLAPRLALSEQAHSEYPPKAPVYAWWALTYGDLAPTEVTDMCGGWAGSTTWADVSPKCATWTVTMLRCGMVCNNANRIKGFGECLKTCGVTKPDCSWCSAPDNVPANISDYCKHTCNKWEKCDATFGPKDAIYAGSDEWMTTISKCVYNCKPALQLELDLGFPILWRQRKCQLSVFACGGTDSTKCKGVPACPTPFSKDCVDKVCAPPLGTGMTKCYPDDPYCTGKPVSQTLAEAGGEKVTMTDQCGAGKEGVPCANYDLWKKAKGFPVCAAGLVCHPDKHTCFDEAALKAEEEAKKALEEGDEAMIPAPAPAPAKPTVPPHPQWEDIQAKMGKLTGKNLLPGTGGAPGPGPAPAPAPAPAKPAL